MSLENINKQTYCLQIHESQKAYINIVPTWGKFPKANIVIAKKKKNKRRKQKKSKLVKLKT